jgi:hypothetical protein
VSDLRVGDIVTWKTDDYTLIGWFKSDGKTNYKLAKTFDRGLAYIMDLEEFEGIVVRLSELSRAEHEPDLHSYYGNVWLTLEDLV